MKKEIFVVFHGDVEASFMNPGLNPEGQEQIKKIVTANILPDKPLAIICGTGRRHLETVALIGLKPTNYSPLCGGPEIYSQNERERTVELADGTEVLSKEWLVPNTWKFLEKIPDRSILITGHDFIAGLEKDKIYNGASVLKIYVYNMDGGRQYIDVDVLLRL